MFVQTENNKYYISFARQKVREAPRKARRVRWKTECKIFIMEDHSPLLVSVGTTVQGKKDKDDSLLGCKIALERALKHAFPLNKQSRAAFWKEFHKHHVRPVFSHQARGSENVLSRKRLTMSYGMGTGKLEAFRKVYGGACQHKMKAKGHGSDWCTKHSSPCNHHKFGGLNPHPGAQTRLLQDNVYETVIPRHGPHSWVTWHTGGTPVYGARQQAEDRCHRVDKKPMEITIKNVFKPNIEKILEENADAIRKAACSRTPVDTGTLKRKWHIPEELRLRQKWVNGRWPNALNATLQSLLAEADSAGLEARLLARTGITKYRDEFKVNAAFKSEFKVGQVVTYKGLPHKIRDISGPMLTIVQVVRVGRTQHVALGEDKRVMDWEVAKIIGCWRKLWRAIVGEDSEVAMARENVRAKTEIKGRGMWKMIKSNYCGSCHGKTIFVPKPHQGPRSCSTTKCKYCGTEYWYDNEARTAKKI